MKCSLGMSNFLEEISSLSLSIVFLYFCALIAEKGFFISPWLFFGTLHSDAYIFPFLLYFLLLFFSQLFGGLECKSRKSRNTLSNRQIWPWSTEWSRAKADRVLPRERTGHRKHPLNNTREDSTHGHHQMVNTKIRLIIFFAAKDREALYSQQKQDWELTVAQSIFRPCQMSWIGVEQGVGENNINPVKNC